MKHALAFFRWRVHYRKHFYIDSKFDVQSYFRIKKDEFFDKEEKLFKEDFVRKVEVIASPEKTKSKPRDGGSNKKSIAP